MILVTLANDQAENAIMPRTFLYESTRRQVRRMSKEFGHVLGPFAWSGVAYYAACEACLLQVSVRGHDEWMFTPLLSECPITP